MKRLTRHAALAACAAVALTTTGATAQKDVGKRLVEGPIKRELAKNLAIPMNPPGVRVHHKVQPGFVRWHASFDAAKAKSKTSGKPVLLFQLLGKLDDEFC